MTRMFQFPFFSRFFNSRLYNRYNNHPFLSQHYTRSYEDCLSDTESMHSELVLIMHLDVYELEVDNEQDESDSIDEDSHDDDETIPLSMEVMQVFSTNSGTTDNSNGLLGNDYENSTT